MIIIRYVTCQDNVIIDMFDMNYYCIINTKGKGVDHGKNMKNQAIGFNK